MKALLIICSLLLFSLTGCALDNAEPEDNTIQAEQAAETPSGDESISSGWANLLENLGENDPFSRFYNSNGEEADQLFEEIIEALENKDASSLKELFSPNAAVSAQNIDEEIKSLLDFYDGQIIEYQRYGPASHASKDGSSVVKTIEASYDVTTTTGVYRIALKFYTHDSLTPANIGLLSVYIIKAEDSDMSFAYWGNPEWNPGITIDGAAIGNT